MTIFLLIVNGILGAIVFFQSMDLKRIKKVLNSQGNRILATEKKLYKIENKDKKFFTK